MENPANHEIFSRQETMLLSPIKLLPLIKDQHSLHQWRPQWKCQEMRKWEIFKQETFKAVTLKSSLTITRDSKNFKALDNGLYGEGWILREEKRNHTRVKTGFGFIGCCRLLKVLMFFSSYKSVWTCLSRWRLSNGTDAATCRVEL